MKYSGDFIAQQVSFPYSSFGHPDARVWALNTESKSPMKVRTVQQMMKSENKSPKGVPTAHQTRAIKSKSLHEGPNANMLIADAGSTLCNRPDALQ
jgi:hypothetical protein